MMTGLKYGFVTVVAVLIATFVTLATWEPFFAPARNAPDYRAYSAEILRDEYGVPTIYGETDADVAFGVAIAHAEDDFFTLQDVVAMGQGRYGAIAGESGAQFDYVYHLLGARETARRHYPKLPAATRALFEAYAAGLNQYAGKHRDEVKLARLFPINGEDVAAGFALRQPFFSGLGNVLPQLIAGGEMRREYGPDIPGFPREPSPMDMPEGVDSNQQTSETAAQTPHSALPWGREAAYLGSNSFAIAPERGGGVTTLISNSHQPLRGSVAWYEFRVHSGEGWHFAGANFAGAPYPFLGHNENLGWSNTINRPDMIDIYRLEVNEDGSQYRLDGEWVDLERKTVTLPVKMGPLTLPIRREVLRSQHGPVIQNPDGYFAFRYGGIDRLDQIDAYYRINRARNFEEWQAQIARLAIPSTNFIYADREGNIGYVYNAALPDRPELDEVQADWRGILDGTRSDLIWNGSVTYEELPRVFNPSSGWIYNSNNEPYTTAGKADDLSPDDFSPVLGVERKQTNRSHRAYHLLSEAGVLDREALHAIKYDTGYERNDYMVYLFSQLETLEVSGELAEARDLLLSWDFNADGEGAADALALLMIRDFMGAEYNNSPVPDVESELRKAVHHLNTYFGRIDPPMGQLLRLRNGAVDLPLDGGSDTLRASTTWTVEEDGRLALRHGDSFILWAEWPQPDEAGEARVSSRSVQPFGQAMTRPNSPHYTDQMRLFVEHKLKPVYFWEEETRAAAKSAQRVSNAR